MVVVDTSVWVESVRTGSDRLNEWITSDQILQHPFVIAEFSMGSFSSPEDRTRAIDLLESFELLEVADDSAFHRFVTENRLFGVGIGFADAHLLHACKSRPGTLLATLDKRLAREAERLSIAMAN